MLGLFHVLKRLPGVPNTVVGSYQVGVFKKVEAVYDFVAGHYELFLDDASVGVFPTRVFELGSTHQASFGVVTQRVPSVSRKVHTE